MPRWLERFIIDFQNMSYMGQFMVFLSFFIPFFIMLIFQLIFKSRYRKHKNRKNFLKLADQKNISQKNINFITKIINLLEMEIKPQFLEYSFHFWRLIHLYSRRAIRKRTSIDSAIATMNHLRQIGQRIFENFPDRYNSSKDLPEKIDMSVSIPKINQEVLGTVFSNDDSSFAVYSREFATLQPLLNKNQKTDLTYTLKGKGIYHISTSIKELDKKRPQLIFLNHTLNIYFKNMRRYERFDLSLAIDIKLKDYGFKRIMKIYSGRIFDISRGGARISSSVDLKKDTELFINFFYNEKEFELPAIVLGSSYQYKTRQGYTHLRFMPKNNQEKTQIANIIFVLKELKDAKSSSSKNKDKKNPASS